MEMTDLQAMQHQLLLQLLQENPWQPATNYWRAIEIEQVIRHGLCPGRGLDLGCGDGQIMKLICDCTGTRNLIGLDLDPYETELARRRQLYRGVVTSSSHQLPFASATFDYVFSNSVLEHIGPIDETLAEVSRVLCVRGVFIFTVPGPEFHACLARGHGDMDVNYYRQVDQRCAHLRYWTPQQWSLKLRAAGFEIICESAYMTMSEVQRWEVLASWTSGWLYRLIRRRMRPIEIQRAMGMRRSRFKLPAKFAAALAWLMVIRPEAGGSHGCLYIRAKKISS